MSFFVAAAMAAVFTYSQDTTVVRATAPVWGPTVTLTRELRIGDANGADQYMFGWIWGIAAGSDGSIFVMEPNPASIRQYDATGKYVRSLGRKGQGPGEFAAPNSISLAGDRLFVRDPANRRITIFHLNGNPPEQWPLQSTTGTPQPMTIHPDLSVSAPTAILTGGSSEPAFVRYDSNGMIRDTVRVPKVAYEPRVLSFPVEGGVSHYPVPHAPAPLWAYMPDGRLVGGHPDRYSLLVVGDGKVARVDRSVAPVRISVQQRQEMQDAMTASLRAGAPNFRWTGPGIPDVMPYFSSIDIDADNRIWVRVAAPSIRVPPAKAGDFASYREPYWYDVFSPDLRYLGHVRIPHDGWFRFGTARGDQLWGAQADPDGVQYVVRYKISYRSERTDR